MAIGSRRFQVYIALFSRVGIHRFLDLSLNLHEVLNTRVEENGVLLTLGIPFALARFSFEGADIFEGSTAPRGHPIPFYISSNHFEPNDASSHALHLFVDRECSE